MQLSYPVFPTTLHAQVAEIVTDFFLRSNITDTVLITNSCARDQASAESDLDMAVLVKEKTSKASINNLYKRWLKYSADSKTILAYKNSCIYRHLHVDIINGIYTPIQIELGEQIDYFEIEIGNHLCYSAPVNQDGKFFKSLQQKWLPYYNEQLRQQRLKAIIDACVYDLSHIPILVKRDLRFHALYILNKAVQEYLQALFMANRIYPIAYNKWIKFQLTNLLGKTEMYQSLISVLSIKNIESNEINEKAKLLTGLLDALHV